MLQYDLIQEGEDHCFQGLHHHLIDMCPLGLRIRVSKTVMVGSGSGVPSEVGSGIGLNIKI